VAAARREVSEEAGVRARPIRRLRPVERKKERERISIAYFLMAYAGRTRPLEKRRVRWLAFDEAIEALDLEKSRRLLRSAHRLISRTALLVALSLVVAAVLALAAVLAK